MKYHNAADVLPAELLEHVREYAAGSLIYIPQRAGFKKGWGDNTGARRDIERRNKRIRREKNNGTTIDELTDKYHLSYDTVKKIVYTSE